MVAKLGMTVILPEALGMAYFLAPIFDIDYFNKFDQLVSQNSLLKWSAYVILGIWALYLQTDDFVQ